MSNHLEPVLTKMWRWSRHIFADVFSLSLSLSHQKFFSKECFAADVIAVARNDAAQVLSPHSVVYVYCILMYYRVGVPCGPAWHGTTFCLHQRLTCNYYYHNILSNLCH